MPVSGTRIVVWTPSITPPLPWKSVKCVWKQPYWIKPMVLLDHHSVSHNDQPDALKRSTVRAWRPKVSSCYCSPKHWRLGPRNCAQRKAIFEQEPVWTGDLESSKESICSSEWTSCGFSEMYLLELGTRRSWGIRYSYSFDDLLDTCMLSIGWLEALKCLFQWNSAILLLQ